MKGRIALLTNLRITRNNLSFKDPAWSFCLSCLCGFAMTTQVLPDWRTWREILLFWCYGLKLRYRNIC